MFDFYAWSLRGTERLQREKTCEAFKQVIDAFERTPLPRQKSPKVFKRRWLGLDLSGRIFTVKAGIKCWQARSGSGYVIRRCNFEIFPARRGIWRILSMPEEGAAEESYLEGPGSVGSGAVWPRLRLKS